MSGDDTGSGTVLTLGVVGAVLTALVTALSVTGALRAAHQARGAADLAALAAAHDSSVRAAAPAQACATARDIAAAAGVSIRTLLEGFRHFRGTTPMAALRAMRLKAVRGELLVAAGRATSVTDIALKWGFINLGRFAEAYRKRYGELPSQTLRRVS